jgi:hypothetical protein
MVTHWPCSYHRLCGSRLLMKMLAYIRGSCCQHACWTSTDSTAAVGSNARGCSLRASV